MLAKSPNLSLSMLINFMLIKKHVHQTVLALHRLHSTAANCAHELINRESGIKGGGWQNSPKLINREC